VDSWVLLQNLQAARAVVDMDMADSEKGRLLVHREEVDHTYYNIYI
jgi:hypothetical protein